MGFGPGHVGLPVRGQPGIAGADRAVVHIVAEVGYDERHSRQRREIARPRVVGLVVGGILAHDPVGSRVVLAGVVAAVGAAGAAQETVRRHGFAVGDDTQPGADELLAQGRRGEGVGTAVVGHTLVGATPELVIVGLAGVTDGEGLGHQRVLLGQRIFLGRRRV